MFTKPDKFVDNALRELDTMRDDYDVTEHDVERDFEHVELDERGERIEHTPRKYTVAYYDAQLDLHVERIESLRPLHEIEATYYADFDVEYVREGWTS